MEKNNINYQTRKINKIKLTSVCLKNNVCFSKNILGNHYCKLSLSGHKIDCLYFGEKDHNQINRCEYFNKLN